MNRLVGKHVECKASAALSSSAKFCICARQGAFISEVWSHSFLKPPRLLKQGSILTVVCRHPADCSHRYHRSTKLVELTQARSLNIFWSLSSLRLTKVFLSQTHLDSYWRKCFSDGLTQSKTRQNVTHKDSLRLKFTVLFEWVELDSSTVVSMLFNTNMSLNWCSSWCCLTQYLWLSVLSVSKPVTSFFL